MARCKRYRLLLAGPDDDEVDEAEAEAARTGGSASPARLPDPGSRGTGGGPENVLGSLPLSPALQAQLDALPPANDVPDVDRVGMDEEFVGILGVDIPHITIPVRPGRDLARIAALYEEELATRSAADFALLLRYAIAAAGEGKHRLLGLPVVLLDVDLKAALVRQLAESVIERAPAVFDGRLKTQAGELGTQPASTLERIRESLFAETVSPDGEPDSSLDYFSAAGESLECVEIARRILKSAKDGVAFDRMAILLRSPERYQPLVEEALRRAGIPAYFSRGVARPDPAGRRCSAPRNTGADCSRQAEEQDFRVRGGRAFESGAPLHLP